MTGLYGMWENSLSMADALSRVSRRSGLERVTEPARGYKRVVIESRRGENEIGIEADAVVCLEHHS